MPSTAPPTLRVNRAPVLTLWAAVVAERLGHAEETALTLGRAVAGASARAKARRLGIADERRGEEDRTGGERHAKAAPARTLRPIGREVAVADDGAALDGGRPTAAAGVHAHLARAFGERLGDVRPAMETRRGFRSVCAVRTEPSPERADRGRVTKARTSRRGAVACDQPGNDTGGSSCSDVPSR